MCWTREVLGDRYNYHHSAPPTPPCTLCSNLIALHTVQCTVVCNLVRTGVHWNVGLQQLRCWQITKGRMQLCVRVRASILPTKSQPVKISLKLYLIRVILGLPKDFSFSEYLLLLPVFFRRQILGIMCASPPPTHGPPLANWISVPLCHWLIESFSCAHWLDAG